ncbi:MAG: hypothetical protein O9342_13435 [Beijerinckiaceae bacterium]|nr:hypothetical protein [Beijerinckiaceae bacterium]
MMKITFEDRANKKAGRKPCLSSPASAGMPYLTVLLFCFGVLPISAKAAFRSPPKVSRAVMIVATMRAAIRLSLQWPWHRNDREEDDGRST